MNRHQVFDRHEFSHHQVCINQVPTTPAIHTLSLHDALPIWVRCWRSPTTRSSRSGSSPCSTRRRTRSRSEEHTSELQSPVQVVCRLLLEEKKSIPTFRLTS